MRHLICLICLLSITACVAPPTRYVWGRYEEGLYSYYADPSKSDDLIKALAEATTAGDAGGKTAPGLHAEYGYMLLSAGRSADAVAEFERERSIWPESRVLMDKMIASTSAGKMAPAAPASAPSKTGT